MIVIAVLISCVCAKTFEKSYANGGTESIPLYLVGGKKYMVMNVRSNGMLTMRVGIVGESYAGSSILGTILTAQISQDGDTILYPLRLKDSLVYADVPLREHITMFLQWSGAPVEMIFVNFTVSVNCVMKSVFRCETVAGVRKCGLGTVWL